MTRPSAESTSPQSQGPAEVLKEARRRDSRAKRARVLEAIRSLQQSGDKITHAAVARSAGVSSWLTYAGGMREHVDAAINAQAASSPIKRGNQASTTSLRVDLELARKEITKLRAERDQLQDVVRIHLGQQLDHVASQDLVTRIQELTQAAAHLEGSLHQITTEKTSLERRVGELEDDLAAARTSLRQMIKETSR